MIRPYVAIVLFAVLAGVSSYAVDGLLVSLKVFATVLVVPSVFLAAQKFWIGRKRDRGVGGSR